MKNRYEVAIVGAGPAGMAAAETAARLGLATVIFDEQPAPGGQIYRAVERSPMRAQLGVDYARGQSLVAQLRGCGADYLASATVWAITGGRRLAVSAHGRSFQIEAEAIILATGALERAVPFPGWTLPGVMTAGAAQFMLKSSATVADDAVFAGSGPLLYFVAAQYIAAGSTPKAVIDTTPWVNYGRALRYLPGALRRSDMLKKGVGSLSLIRRSGVPFRKGVQALEAVGSDRLREVRYRRRGGAWSSVSTEHLFIHQGVLPNPNLAVAAGCRQRWDERQQCWHPVLDQWLRSTVDGIRIAGDGAGIAGAIGAEHRGRLSAIGAAHDLGYLTEADAKAQAEPVRRALATENAIRPFLDTLYAPRGSFGTPDALILCRCEEVSVAQLRAAVRHGARDLNSVKNLTRCGMGACQGRTCGSAIARLVADETGRTAAETGHYRSRPPVKPVPWPELAALDTPGNGSG